MLFLHALKQKPAGSQKSKKQKGQKTKNLKTPKIKSHFKITLHHVCLPFLSDTFSCM